MRQQLTDERKTILDYIKQNGPRERIVQTVIERGKGYLSQLSRDLNIAKRTVLIQLSELGKRDILTEDWETRYVGKENRPVYLKVFLLSPNQNWLRNIYKPSKN